MARAAPPTYPLASSWLVATQEQLLERGEADFPADLQAAIDFSEALDRSGGAELVTTWCEDLPHNPYALQRARVVFARRRTYAYSVDRDVVYRDELRVLWRAAGLGPKQGDLAVLMAFSGDHGPRPDGTNLGKAIEDAGNGFLWVDDRQIRTELLAIVGWGRGQPRRVALDVWRLG